MDELRGVVGVGAQEGGQERTAVAYSCSMAVWSEGQRARFSKPLRLVPAAVRTHITPRQVAEQCLSALFGASHAISQSSISIEVIKCATDNNLTGFALMCGAFSAAYIAERLFSFSHSGQCDMATSTFIGNGGCLGRGVCEFAGVRVKRFDYYWLWLRTRIAIVKQPSAPAEKCQRRRPTPRDATHCRWRRPPVPPAARPSRRPRRSRARRRRRPNRRPRSRASLTQTRR